MGVYGLHRWFRKYFYYAYSAPAKGAINVSYLCFDLNGLVHECARKTWHEHFVFEHLSTALDDIIDFYAPSKGILLFVDGTAPFAKIRTQKKRRQHPLPSDQSGFEPIQITPGTLFSHNLNQFLHQYAKSKINKNHNLSIFISGSDIPGEAELKIMKFIKSNDNDSFLIVGDDSDLLLLAMMTFRENVYVLCRQRTLIFNLNVVELDRELYIDFVTCCLIMGNDYLPKIREVFWGSLWGTYLTLKKEEKWRNEVLIDKSGINVEFLYALLNLASNKEYVEEEEEEDYDEEEISLNFPTDSNKKSVERVEKYLQGLYWNILMYIKSECLDFHFIYPVDSAPNIQEFNTWLAQKTRFKPEINERPALHPFQSAILLVPGWGKDFLPNEVQEFVNEEVVEISSENYGEFQLEELKKNWNSAEQIEEKLLPSNSLLNKKCETTLLNSDSSYIVYHYEKEKVLCDLVSLNKEITWPIFKKRKNVE